MEISVKAIVYDKDVFRCKRITYGREAEISVDVGSTVADFIERAVDDADERESTSLVDDDGFDVGEFRGTRIEEVAQPVRVFVGRDWRIDLSAVDAGDGATLTVKFSKGAHEPLTIPYSYDLLVRQMRLVVAERCRIDPESFRFVFAGRVLQDWTSMAVNCIQRESTLHVVIK